MDIVWKIEKLNRRESDGYVTAANVKVYADNGIGNNFIELACSWPNGEMLTPYEQLTENQVLSWVFASCNRQSVEDNLTCQISKTTKIVSGLPWA
jgi:hypothetical protein